MVSMKLQFEKVKKLAIKKQDESKKLDQMIDKKWGFSYSDEDIDEIIDSLDYGTGDISFERFVKLMNNPEINFVKSESSEVK